MTEWTMRFIVCVTACVLGGCTVGSRQSLSTSERGVEAGGGLPNVTEVKPGKAQSGANYPLSAISSTPEAFSATNPGSQATAFNPSFGTIMVPGTLKAEKLRAWVNPQGDDEITVEGLEIDNTANSATEWAKSVSPALIEQIRANSADFKAQVEALQKTGEAVAPLALQLLRQIAGGV
jgi:hypothetical protein